MNGFADHGHQIQTMLDVWERQLRISIACQQGLITPEAGVVLMEKEIHDWFNKYRPEKENEALA